ncbi:DNA polymerase family B-domain-containing protein [Glomus cerebriforme]|uniref:DNA polymerase n=1 Tax=Glomus cerebriforme TaxID=658196 RepID=A0A397SUS2_9GLOM|nr:DNA polymerase family B-domain-containing protein [Glomus cerebriforme]
MSGRTRQETSKNIIQWNYYGRLGEVTTSDEILSMKENTEEDVKEEFRRDSIFIKVSLEDIFKSSFLKISGCVPIDIHACFKRLYPYSEVEKKSSLKFYLKLCELESNADMSFNRLWNYYSEVKELSSDITARNIEVASIAYVSLFDTYYHANGMKGKYSGAYVFPSIKGIENKRPVTGLDFTSLYPSLIMAYNLSPEKLILSHEEANNICEKGNELYEIKFPFNSQDLFNKRVDLKSKFILLRKEKERLEKLISIIEGKGKIIPNALKSKHDSLYFDYNYLNSKQFALKVYMNIFYGEAGNSNSPFFLCELAGGITSAGQYNIDFVTKFVTAKEFGIKYGDTDSLYLTCPDKYYETCDRAFNKDELSKEAYWTEMVKITMEVMDEFCNKVNAYLRIKNGISYLKMAYEKVLFPMCFTGKKKYFEIRHEEVVNFKPKSLFTKGIDTVKQSQSQLFKFIGEKIMWEAMDINNTCSIHKIVKDTLRETSLKQWGV